MIYAGIALLATFCGLLWYIHHDSFKAGKEESENQSMKNLLSEVRRAKVVRDAINADPSIRDKLRNKYER